QRERLWVDLPVEEKVDDSPKKLENPAEWLYVPVWEQTAPVSLLGRRRLDVSGQNWLVFADETALSRTIVESLASAAPDRTVVARAGVRNERVGPAEWSIDAASTAGYRSVIDHVVSSGWTSVTVVHLWTLTNGGFDAFDADSIRRAQQFGLYSVLK